VARSKKTRKKICGKCIICKESNQKVLDIHRIIPGCEGGTYIGENCVTLCANCHRKVHHTDEIKIEGWVMSTAGMLLHCHIDGEENYLKS
jgi:5-methylcytosine-specific restriction endonuclease McrA